jgi:chromosome segregation ATPase
MVFLGNISYSQSDTVFTSDELIRINSYIDSLQTEVDVLNRKQELNQMLIEEYKKGNEELSDLLTYKERYIKVRESQYSLMEQSLDSYKEYIKANRRAFWDKPIVWFIVGAGTIYFSSTIVANVK